MKQLKPYILAVLLLFPGLQLLASNVARNATAVKTSGDYSSTYSGWKAIDGTININSRWVSNGIATEPWLALDLGNNYAITSFKLFHAGYVGEPAISNALIYRVESGSSIDGPWTTITTYNNPSLQNVTISNVNVTARFIRLYVTDPGADNYTRIPEFEIEGTTTGGGGTNVARTATNVATSGDYNSSYTGAKAIDGNININSRWISNGTTLEPWLALDLGANYSITKFVLYHAGYVGEPQISNAVSYRLESGSSITGPWTTITTYNNAALQNVTTSNVNATARFVRLYITDPGADNYARIPEFEVYGTTTTSGPSNLQRTPPNCGNAGYVVNFSWTGSGNGWWIDISSDPNFAISNTYHKQISNVNSTNSADFCIMQYNCNYRLTLQPNVTYYWRIWNTTSHVNGPSFSVTPCTGGSCPGLYGIHWWSSSASNIMNGKKGWTLEILDTDRSMNTLDATFASIRSQSIFEPIVRLNKSAVPFEGTIPGNTSEYSAFATKCAEFAAHLFNNYQIKYVVIGNEPNQVYENQLGQTSLQGNAAEDYANCFVQCYNAIKQKVPQVNVLVAAPGNWSDRGPLTRGGGYAYYDLYWERVVQRIGTNCHGYAIHTYGKHNTSAIDNNLQAKYRGISNSWEFESFKVLMKIISDFGKTTVPVIITETNSSSHQYTFESNPCNNSPCNPADPSQKCALAPPCVSYTSGWMQEAYNRINSWNQTNTQKILGLCWFVYFNRSSWGNFALENPVGNSAQARTDFNSLTASTNYSSGCANKDLTELRSSDEGKAAEGLPTTLRLKALYPVPASDKMHLEIFNTLKNDIKVRIYDILGNDLSSETIKNLTEQTETDIDVSHLRKGFYWLNISNGINEQTKKIMVQ